jgi:hypothetical protein
VAILSGKSTVAAMMRAREQRWALNRQAQEISIFFGSARIAVPGYLVSRLGFEPRTLALKGLLKLLLSVATEWDRMSKKSGLERVYDESTVMESY